MLGGTIGSGTGMSVGATAAGSGDEVGNRPIAPGFRDAMRRLAGTVTIVTVCDGETRHGTTATAVTSLSMDPPSLLVCLNRDTRLYGILSRTDRFCVNLLHCENIEVSRKFASPIPVEERFAAGDWVSDEAGAPPYLGSALASIQCVKESAVDYGSHTVFIGRVLSVRNREDIAPLVYVDGSYVATTALKASESG
jgi:flavin reductase (DIM6/NTAB) family NADH-FMN oxidoreductase RutF